LRGLQEAVSWDDETVRFSLSFATIEERGGELGLAYLVFEPFLLRVCVEALLE
jgi:hypothetical protein